jgi:hypothetical protein
VRRALVAALEDIDTHLMEAGMPVAGGDDE